MGRRRNRTGQQRYGLFSASGPNRAPRFIRRISDEEGEKMVRANRAVCYSDPDTGECLGFELTARSVAQKTAPVGTRDYLPPYDSGSKPSSPMLTVHEAEMAIGIHGESRTEKLPSWRRRLASFEEDPIERAKVKLAAHAPRYRA